MTNPQRGYGADTLRTPLLRGAYRTVTNRSDETVTYRNRTVSNRMYRISLTTGQCGSAELAPTLGQATLAISS
jgi:hypothetical protein